MLREIEQMLAETGLAYENIGVAAIRATLDIEGSRGWLSLLRFVPDRMFERLAPAVPTLIFRLRRNR